VARLIGKIVHLPGDKAVERLMVIGPGRFGTTVPELGIPVTSGEINGVCVLCEINVMHEGLNPELSFGTHFFHELVESNMLYLGCAVTRPNNLFREDYFEEAPNHLAELLPDDASLAHVVRVIEAPLTRQLMVRADNRAQDAVLYIG
jgi:hypothetical protein